MTHELKFQLGSNKDRIKINVDKNMINTPTKKKKGLKKFNATNEKDIGEDKQNEIGCFHIYVPIRWNS